MTMAGKESFELPIDAFYTIAITIVIVTLILCSGTFSRFAITE